jgi:hypothetical protein
MDNLNDEWQFIIFHGNKNKEYVEKIIDNNFKDKAHKIKLVDLKVDNLTIPDYNKLFFTKEFYDNIPTETFLVFQTDSMIFPRNKYYLNNFLKYDYVGAYWPHLNNVGNGGFSLRKKSKMIEIIETEETPNDAHYPEDMFFALPTKVSLYKPSNEESCYFCFEGKFWADSFGCHQPWLQDKKHVLAYYPEAEELYKLNDKV